MDVVRRPRRLVAALAVLPLVVVLAGCARENDRSDDGSAGAGASDGPTPTDAQWCTLWRSMAEAQAQFAVAGDPATADLLLQAIEQLEAAGYPAAMSEGARDELDLVLNDVHSVADPSWTPTGDATGIPTEGAEAEEDAPFATYLTEHCPA